MRLSRTRCQLCGACEINCPIGAIEIFEDIVYVCDLCGGDPKCIEACSEDAITWHRDPHSAVSLADAREGSKKLNPSERRYTHAIQQAAGLQREWFRV